MGAYDDNDRYREAAANIRAANHTHDPGRIAAVDQLSCALRDVWQYRGVDLTDPVTAHAVFATIGWAFCQLVETLDEHTEPAAASTAFGERLIATATAVAEFVR